jgi:hypothetical protein
MSNKSPRTALQERAISSILINAFFSWPSAVIITFFTALFLLGVKFPTIPIFQSWMWIVIGAIAEAFYLGVTVTDPESSRKVVSKMLEDQFDPGKIRNANAREQVKRAIHYKELIDKMADERTGAMKEQLKATSSDIQSWIEYIYMLAQRIDTFEGNTTIRRDQMDAEAEIANLRRRAQAEADPQIRVELEEGVRIRQNKLNALTEVGKAATRAELKMENTVAQLGTVHAQMALLGAKDLDSGRSQRLQESIREEVAQLSDTISAMDDMYTATGYIAAVDNLSESGSGVSNPQSQSTSGARRASRGQ